MERKMIINCINESNNIIDKQEVEYSILSVIQESGISVNPDSIEVEMRIVGPLDNDIEGTIKEKEKVLFTFTGSIKIPVSHINHAV
jgi:hypothetical protein